MQDMQSEELRLVIDTMQSSGQFFSGTEGDGVKFDILSGYLEKGLPEFPLPALKPTMKALPAWDADGIGPGTSGIWHTFTYNGINLVDGVLRRFARL